MLYIYITSACCFIAPQPNERENFSSLWLWILALFFHVALWYWRRMSESTRSLSSTLADTNLAWILGKKKILLPSSLDRWCSSVLHHTDPLSTMPCTPVPSMPLLHITSSHPGHCPLFWVAVMIGPISNAWSSSSRTTPQPWPWQTTMFMQHKCQQPQPQPSHYRIPTPIPSRA